MARLRGQQLFVTITLDKNGGLTEALALADAASAMGFGQPAVMQYEGAIFNAQQAELRG